MPQHVPEIAHEDSAVHSLDSISSEHIQSIPSFADQQLEAERAEEAAAEEANEAKQSAKEFGQKAQSKGEELKKKAGVQGKKAKEEAKEAEEWADKNKGNPVVIGNVVAVAALGGLLGIGAYRKYNAGELTWKVAGAWAGAVGLFAAGDYYVSQYVLTFSNNGSRECWLMLSQMALQEPLPAEELDVFRRRYSKEYDVSEIALNTRLNSICGSAAFCTLFEEYLDRLTIACCAGSRRSRTSCMIHRNASLSLL